VGLLSAAGRNRTPVGLYRFEPAIRRYMRFAAGETRLAHSGTGRRDRPPAQYPAFWSHRPYKLDTVLCATPRPWLRPTGKAALAARGEGVVSQVYGELASTAEVEQGRSISKSCLLRSRAAGVEADLEVVTPKSAPAEIIALCPSPAARPSW